MPVYGRAEFDLVDLIYKGNERVLFYPFATVQWVQWTFAGKPEVLY